MYAPQAGPLQARDVVAPRSVCRVAPGKARPTHALSQRRCRPPDMDDHENHEGQHHEGCQDARSPVLVARAR